MKSSNILFANLIKRHLARVKKRRSIAASVKLYNWLIHFEADPSHMYLPERLHYYGFCNLSTEKKLINK